MSWPIQPRSNPATSSTDFHPKAAETAPQFPFSFAGLNLQEAFETLKGLMQVRDRVEAPFIPTGQTTPTTSGSSSPSTSDSSGSKSLRPHMAIPTTPNDYHDISIQDAWDSIPKTDQTAILNVLKNPASAKNTSGTPPHGWLRVDGKRDSASQTQLQAFRDKTLPIKSVEVCELTLGTLFSVKSIQLYTITPEKGDPFQVISYQPHPCDATNDCSVWKYDENRFYDKYEGIFSMRWKFNTDTFSSSLLFYNTSAAPELQMSTPSAMTTFDSRGASIVPGQTYELNGDSLLKEYFANAPKPDGNYSLEQLSDQNASEAPTFVTENEETSSTPTTAPTKTKTVIVRNPTLNFTAPTAGDSAIVWKRFGDLPQANIRNNDILAVVWQTFDLTSNTPIQSLVATPNGSTFTIAGVKFNVTETQPLTLSPEPNDKWQYTLTIKYSLPPSDGGKAIEVFVKTTAGEEVGKLRASWSSTGETKSNYQIALETYSKAPAEEAYEFTGYFSEDLTESDYWVITSPNTQGFATLWLNGKNKDKNFQDENWPKVQQRFMMSSPNYKSSIVWEGGFGNTWDSSDGGIGQSTIGRGGKAKETKSNPARTEPATVGLTSGPVLGLGARVGLNSTTTAATSDFKDYHEDSSSQGLGVSAQALARGGYFFTPNWGVLGEVALGYDLRQSAFMEHGMSSDWNAYFAGRFGVWQFGLGGGLAPNFAVKREGSVTTPQGYTITSPEYLSAWSTSPQAALFASWKILTLGAEYEFSSTNVAEDTQYITGLRTSNLNTWVGVTVPLK